MADQRQYVADAWAEWQRQSLSRLADWDSLTALQQEKFTAAINVAVNVQTGKLHAEAVRYRAVLQRVLTILGDLTLSPAGRRHQAEDAARAGLATRQCDPGEPPRVVPGAVVRELGATP
jgi:hypothetical protein